MKPFHLGWFLGTGIGVQAWDRPWTGRGSQDWAKPDFYVDLARSLERGRFDYLLIEDTSMVPDTYGGNADIYLRNAITAPKHDPVPMVPLMAQATRHLGLVPTLSTTFYPPFLLARLMTTLDHITEGRIGWNVVTSSDRRAGENYGIEMPTHDTRYEMAEEFVELVCQLWESWAPDAVVNDIANGYFADHTKVRPIDFQGKYFSSRGPLNAVPGPQRRPVISQAGSSPTGREFASKYAETIVASTEGVAGMKSFRDDVRSRMVANGRDPDTSKILFLVSPIIGRDDEEAHARDAENKAWWRANVERQLAGVAYNMNIDFSKLDVDAPIPASFTTEGHQGTLNNLRGDGTQTLRERLANYTVWESVDLVGSPATVAAEMGEIMDEVGGDGFLLSNPFPTRRYIDEIVDGLVPALQARGLTREQYSHATLRENLLEF